MGSVRVVVDTNTAVSALGFGGTPLTALLRVFGEEMQLVASDATLAEFARVLTYERLPFTPAEQETYPQLFRREADIVTSPPEITALSRDPDDNMFLGCAVGGDASFIVSGDEHLLSLGSFRAVDIVDAATFLSVT